MKKFYASFVMLLMCVVAFSQNVKVTVITDNIDAMYVQDPSTYYPLSWDTETKSVVLDINTQGFNSTITLVAKSGYNLISAKNQNGIELGMGYATSRISIWSDQYSDGDVITVTTAEKEPKVLVVEADPSMVCLVINGTTTYNADSMVDGAWTVTMSDDSMAEIKTYDGFMLSSITDQQGSNYLYSLTNQQTFYASSLHDGINKFTVTAYNLAEARSKSFILDVDDDFENVCVYRNNISESIPLTEKVTEIWFDPERELPLRISPYDYNKPFYKVTLNDELAEGSASNYNISPENGDYVKVYTIFPDVDLNVKFNFVNEGTEGAINVLVDSQKVPEEEWQSDNFTVKLGHNIGITTNSKTYNLSGMKLNGKNLSFYGSYSQTLTVEQDYIFEVTAEKIPTYNVKLTCNDPDQLQVAIGQYGYDLVDLTGTTTEFEVPTNNNILKITPSATGVITGLTTSNNDEFSDFETVYVTVNGDMTIDVTTIAYVRDKHGMLYMAKGDSDAYYAINGWQGTAFGFSNIYTNPHGWEMVPSVGYNEFEYNDSERPFNVNFYPTPALYYKNEIVEMSQSYPYEYEGLRDFQDGGVIKIYPSPVEPFTITNEIQTGLTVKFTTDSITNEADNVPSLVVLPGTYYTIEPVVEEGQEYVVTINDVEATPVDGIYSTYVNEDTKVIVSAKSAITLVGADNANAQNVYNLQGILLKKNASAADVKALPAGIYLIGGKKCIVR